MQATQLPSLVFTGSHGLAVQEFLVVVADELAELAGSLDDVDHSLFLLGGSGKVTVTVTGQTGKTDCTRQ